MGVFLVAPIPVALEPDKQPAELPIVAPLQAADEAHRGTTVCISKPVVNLAAERHCVSSSRYQRRVGGIKIIPAPALLGARHILALTEVEANIKAGPIVR